MNKPIFCVSTDNEHGEFASSPVERYKLSHAYTDALSSAGALPIMACEGHGEEYADFCDALLLTGGGDVDPAYYGEEIKFDSIKPDPVRDKYEEELFWAFRKAGKPIFGICRGCQFINVLLGGSLYQDIQSQTSAGNHFDVTGRHFMITRPGSFLSDLFGERVNINSTHHQAVCRLADGLIECAVSEDGIIEAYRHESYPIYATQYHPERLTGAYNDERCIDHLPLFRFYVNIAKNRK